MSNVFNQNGSSSAIYRKALEIFQISRQISNYLRYDLSILKANGVEDPYIYFTGDIVRQSSSLAPEILQAELKVFSEEREKHIYSINRLIYLLNKNCDRLELSNSNGREFLKVLRKELKKFRKLQRQWMLRL